MKKQNMTKKKRPSKSVPMSKQNTPIPPPVTEVVHMTTAEQQELRKLLFSSPTRPPVIGQSVISIPPTVSKNIVVDPIPTEESNCESRKEYDPVESTKIETHNKQWDIALVQSTKVAERTLQRVMRSYQKRSAIMGGPNKRSISGIPYIFNPVTKNLNIPIIPSSPYHVHKEQNNPSSSSSLQKPPSRPTTSSGAKGMSPLKNRIIEKSTITTVTNKVLFDKSNALGTLEDDNVSEISSIQSFGALATVDIAAVSVDETLRVPPIPLTTTVQQEAIETVGQEINMNDVNHEIFAVVVDESVIFQVQQTSDIVPLHKDSEMTVPDDTENNKPAVIASEELEVEKEEEITSLSAADLENHAADINPASHSSSSNSSSSSSNSRSNSKSSHSNEKEMQEDSSELWLDTERTAVTKNVDGDEEDDASIEIDNRFISKLNNKFLKM